MRAFGQIRSAGRDVKRGGRARWNRDTLFLRCRARIEIRVYERIRHRSHRKHSSSQFIATRPAFGRLPVHLHFHRPYKFLPAFLFRVNAPGHRALFIRSISIRGGETFFSFLLFQRDIRNPLYIGGISLSLFFFYFTVRDLMSCKLILTSITSFGIFFFFFFELSFRKLSFRNVKKVA